MFQERILIRQTMPERAIRRVTHRCRNARWSRLDSPQLV
ncbi:hypothetical protein C7S14_3313 [Burkholderia cepacia]|nr:hypothetical protein C7S14_3313 [Burkholderia cepacia]